MSSNAANTEVDKEEKLRGKRKRTGEEGSANKKEKQPKENGKKILSATVGIKMTGGS